MICKVHTKDIKDWYVLIQVEYIIVKQESIELQHAFNSGLNIIIPNKYIHKMYSDTVQVVISVLQEYYNKITEILQGNNQLFEKVGKDHTPVANIQSFTVAMRSNINMISYLGVRIGYYDDEIPVYGYKNVADEPDKVMVYIMPCNSIVPYWLYGDKNKLRLLHE